MLIYAILCCALLYYSVVCFTSTCCALLCCALPCCAVLCCHDMCSCAHVLHRDMKDYHINEGEEIFLQLEGDMELKILEQGKVS